MSIEDFVATAQIIADHDEASRFRGEQPDELVERAEAALGIKLPPSYRAFVRQLGAGHIAGEEFYGVTSDDFVDSSVPNGIWLTLTERQDSGLPDPFVIVYEDDEGDYYALDSSRDAGGGEYPVVRWTPGGSEPGDDLEIVASDFGSFFRETVQDGLSRRGITSF